LIIPQDDFELPEKYDVIFTDAVVEHLEAEQQERYVKKLGSYLKKFGLLCLLIDLEGSNPEMPMHNDVNIFKLHSLLEQAGLSCVYGKNTFSSRWVRMY
jgi:chemotaxis methyl-accepting protein methylase